MNESSYLSPLRETYYPTILTENSEQNLEVGDILEENIKIIKNLLNIFLDSIISTIYNIPLHIRLFLKLLESRVSECTNASNEEINSILSNFLFLKWIIPKFSNPIFTGIGFDSDFLEKHAKNLFLLSSILHKVVKSTIYDISSPDFMCFNDFIEENK